VRVLISAYACTPGDGSEPGAGWAWAQAAARMHQVVLLTRANNARGINAALVDEPDLDLTPVYIDLPAWARFWKRGKRGARLYALVWQILAWRETRRAHVRQPLDLAHHVTFATDWLPAGAAWVRGVPFVWGPVGGATTAPLSLWRWLGARGAIEDAIRLLVGRAGRATFGRATARRAALVVAQNQDTLKAFEGSPTALELNVAIDARLLPTATRRHRATHIPTHDAVFVGRLTPWKGARLAIETLRHLPPEWSLQVFGTGPDLGRCVAASHRLGLAHRVTFHGHVSREAVLAAVSSCDVVLHPSLHDSAPWSVGEAVASGTPVVALALGGPSALLARGGGIAVPPVGDVPRALAEAVVRAAVQAPSDEDWTDRRLPAVLDALYSAATSAPPCR
jgi:glycosyltransferase involved in cell wall biosynthesis